MASSKRQRGERGESSRAPRIDTMGLRNLNNEQLANWSRVYTPRREVQETKFFDDQTLNALGLGRPIRQLLTKVGLRGFMDAKAQTFVRYTLEFLATIDKARDEEGPFITFNLNDEFRKMYYPEVMEAFGWDYVEDDDFYHNEVYHEAMFFGQITGGVVWHSRVKSSCFPHPALRLVHRFLAPTIFCSAEPTNVPRLDLRCLWAMTPEGVGCPDWVDIFVGKVIALRNRDKGNFSFGGLVTLLAEYLNVEPPTDRNGHPLLVPLGSEARPTYHSASENYHLTATNEYNIAYLKSCGMLLEERDNHGVYRFIWLFGTRGVKYMILPQPNKTEISPNASHVMLFVPPDRQYEAEVQLEFNRLIGGAQPQQEQPHQQQEQEVEEEEDRGNYAGLGRGGRRRDNQGPRFGEQSQNQGWQTTMDQRMQSFELAQNSIEMRLDQMQFQFDTFEDNMYSMSSMVSAMNQFYVSQYPTYNDPSQEIERSRQQRQQERASRRRGSRDPGGPSGS